MLGDAATGTNIVHEFWSLSWPNQPTRLIHTWGPDFSDEGRSARWLRQPADWQNPGYPPDTSYISSSIEDASLHGEPGSTQLITFYVVVPGVPLGTSQQPPIERGDNVVVRTTNPARSDPAEWEWTWTIEKGPWGPGGTFPDA